MPIYLIFGSDGLIGNAMIERLNETVPEHRVFSFNHSQADISNRQHIKEIIGYVRPTVVINCAGISSPEICEQAPSGAYVANSVGPKILAELCQKVQAKLVHFSSYAVFDGKRSQPYSERCKPVPASTYGRSKQEGEKAVQSACKDYLVIRTGWLFHYQEPNFLRDWISAVDERRPIYVRSDLHGSPTYVPDLVSATKDLMDKDAIGIYHVVNTSAATMESLAQAFIELTKAKSNVIPIAAGDALQSPRIPAYGVLSSRKYASMIGVEMRTWPSALKHCLFTMERFKP